jgi:hypothetical protein
MAVSNPRHEARRDKLKHVETVLGRLLRGEP